MLLAEKFRILFKQLKLLRIMLLTAALIIIVLAPGADSTVSYEGWAMVPTLLLPTLAPLIFMVLLLDSLMSRVWMIDAKGSERNKFKNIIKVNLFVVLLLVLAWAPFFIRLWN